MELNPSSYTPAIAARREEMLSRLEGKRAERDGARDARRLAMGQARQDMGTELDISRTPEKFWSAFNEKIKELKSRAKESIAGGLLDEESGNQVVSIYNDDHLFLQNLINDYSDILPAFDLRRAQFELENVQSTIDEVRLAVCPRKKFQFSRKTRQLAEEKHKESLLKASAASGASEVSDPTFGDQAADVMEDEVTISDRTDELIVIPFGQYTTPAQEEIAKIDASLEHLKAVDSTVSTSEEIKDLERRRRVFAASALGQDIRLLNLTRCVVIIEDPLRALRVDNLQHCHLYVGTVSGSILLHRSRGCVIAAASRQWRLHTSEDCDFYLSARGRPIFEHCSRLGFAPCIVGNDRPLVQSSGSGENKELSISSIRETNGLIGGADMWDQVDDFNWHRVQKSPNWFFIQKKDGLQENLSVHIPPSEFRFVRGDWEQHRKVLSEHAVGRGWTVKWGEHSEKENGSSHEEPAKSNVPESLAPTPAPVVASAPAPASVGDDDDEL